MFQLSDIAIYSIRKKGVHKLCKEIIKCLLFYVVSLGLLFVVSHTNHVFTMEKSPIAFWIIFSVLILLPLIRYGFCKLPFKMKLKGSVIEIKNDRRMAPIETKSNYYAPGGALRTALTNVDACDIVIRSQRGLSFTYTFLRNEAAVARGYYVVGDEVMLPPWANFPVVISREIKCPVCPWCGCPGADMTAECEECGVIFIDEETPQYKEE